MERLMDDEVIRAANKARKDAYRKTQEDLRGRRLANKKIVERRRANAKKLLIVNAIGSLALISVISMGVAYSQAKDKLIKSKGGAISFDDKTGYSTVVGASEPSFKEVIEFMFDDAIDGLGKGR